MSSIYALKFTKSGAVASFSGLHWPVPNGKPGKWVSVKGALVPCENGIHAATFPQALGWLNAECYVIELTGVTDAGDKLVARRGRLIRRVEDWDERAQRLFAADCAYHVLPIFEKRYPDDKRPREAIRAARAYARHPNERTAAARHAAWDAAQAAARAAVQAAARDAAQAAAQAAAWAAVQAAARDAAWAAAWDAAWDAAQAAAWDAAWDAAQAAVQAAARDAAWAAVQAAAQAAARHAARDAERTWQSNRLRSYIDAPEVGEAA